VPVSELPELPEWAQRLHTVLNRSGHSADALLADNGLLCGADWLTAALDGTVKPTVSQLAVVSAVCEVPLAVLVGLRPLTDIEPDR